MNTDPTTESASASPVSPDADAIVRRLEAQRRKPFGQRLRSSIIDALTAYAIREREACAQIADKAATVVGTNPTRERHLASIAASMSIAAAIRARSAPAKEGK